MKLELSLIGSYWRSRNIGGVIRVKFIAEIQKTGSITLHKLKKTRMEVGRPAKRELQ